jgi:4-amino-4-deoxy-L-arabinose transferase-like glycosyltransferase
MPNTTTWYKDIICLIIFFSVLFMLFLGGHHLISPDETRYVGIAWDMYKDNNYVTPTLAGSPFLGKPVLYYWLEIISFHTFGVSEFSARFFPAVIGIITCLMTYVFGRLVFNRRMGIVASLMVAAAPMYFALTHYTNMDGEVASWITCSMLSFLIGVHHLKTNKHTATWFYLSYAFAALAFLTKGLIGLVFPAMIIFFWVLILNDWRSLLKIRLLSGLILFVIIIAPWLYLCEQQNPGFLYYFFIWNQFFRFVGDDFNQQKACFYYLPMVIGGIFPFVLYMLQSYGTHIKNIFVNKKSHPVELFLLLWIVLITLFFSIPSSKLVGYIGPVIPATAILMAIYVCRKWDEQPSKANRISTWVLIILLPLMAITVISLAFIIPEQQGILASAPYARFLGVLLLITSAVLFYGIHKKKKFGFIISALLAMIFIMNVCLIASLKTWNLQWNWPIAEKVEHYLKSHPKAEVLMFGRYYYSVPMYLGRNVPAVAGWDEIDRATLSDNWQREIYEGLKYYEKSLPDTLMTYTVFKKDWKDSAHKTIIVIVDNGHLKEFESLIGDHQYKILANVPRRHVTIVTNNLQLKPTLQ